MNVERRMATLYSRGRLYRGLAECFYLPEQDLINTLEDLRQHADLLQSSAAAWIKSMSKAFLDLGELQTLRVEFARLFVGPFRPPVCPYGSVYIEKRGRVMDDSTMDVLCRYREAGVDLGEDFKDAPDHVAVELEFVHYLICRELRALGGAPEACPDYERNLRHLFLRRHLGSWVGPFTEDLYGHAQEPYYQNLAHALRIFIEEDLKHLDSELESK